MISQHNNILSKPHYMLCVTRCIIRCIQIFEVYMHLTMDRVIRNMCIACSLLYWIFIYCHSCD